MSLTATSRCMSAEPHSTPRRTSRTGDGPAWPAGTCAPAEFGVADGITPVGYDVDLCGLTVAGQAGTRAEERTSAGKQPIRRRSSDT